MLAVIIYDIPSGEGAMNLDTKPNQKVYNFLTFCYVIIFIFFFQFAYFSDIFVLFLGFFVVFRETDGVDDVNTLWFEEGVLMVVGV